MFLILFSSSYHKLSWTAVSHSTKDDNQRNKILKLETQVCYDVGGG